MRQTIWNNINITPKMRDDLIEVIEKEGLAYKDDIGVRRMYLILKNENFRGVHRNTYIKLKARVNFLLDKRKENKNEFDWKKPFRPPPDEGSGVSDGDIQVGRTLESNIPVRLKRSELTKHACMVGMTGFGKTTLLTLIMTELMKIGVPFLGFDRKGGQFRKLQLVHRHELLVVRVGIDQVFNFNVWPKNCDRTAYLSRRSDFRAGTFERHDSQVFFNRAVNNLLPLCEPKLGIYFSEHELIRELQTMNLPPGLSLNKALRSSQLAISDGLIQSPLGKSLHCCRGILPGELARKRISLVTETFFISNQHDLLLQTQFLNQCYSDLQVDASQHVDELRVVYMCDEGSHIYTNYKTSKPILELQAQVRFAGIGCMVGTTSAHALADSYQGNVFAYFAFHQFNTDDIKTVARSMFLDRSQAECLTHLPRFICVVKLGDRYTKPFLMEIE